LEYNQRRKRVNEFEKETEIKFVVDQDILNKISSIDLKPYEEIDEYFTTKEMLNNYTFLRIRRKKDKIILQLKDVIVGGEQTGDVYESDEVHMELDKEMYEKIKKILSSTFPYSFVVKKIRKKGKLNECEICLDEVEELGLFLEIEGPKEKILEICKKLDLDLKKRDAERGYAIMMAKKVGLL
jgi:predicted adenylyl cyclase CyaB